MNTVVALQTEIERVDAVADISADDLRLHNAGRIARTLWKLLLRCKPKFSKSYRHSRIRTVSIDATNILNAIGLSELDIRRIYNHEAKFLLIGRDYAARLFGELESRHYFEFPVNARFGMGGQMFYRGLACVVVPWMNGFVLVPELKQAAGR